MFKHVDRTNMIRKIRSGIVFSLLLIVFILMSNAASAAHTSDTNATDGTGAFATTPNPRNLSYTTGTGSTVMVLNIFTAGTTARAGGAPTFNDKTMTQVGTRQQSGATSEGATEMWYLLLTVGDTGSSHNVSVPNTGSLAMRIHVSTYKSATGQSALDVYAQTNSVSPNPNQSITTTANGDVIVAGMFTGLNTAPTVTSPGISIYINGASGGGTYKAASQYILQSSFGTNTTAWTSGTSDDWGMITAAFKEVGSPIPTYTPPTPAGLTPAQNNFWVNYTWTAGAGENITNSYNVSHNGSWSNNTITFRNNTVGPHGWSNITVYAYNSSGTGQMSQTPATMETQVVNNIPVLGSIGNREVTAGQLLTITISATDADSDPLTNATNATKGSFTSPNVYEWTPAEIDVGTHLLEFNTSDTYGGVDSETITVTVNAATYIPPAPTITDIFQGNFWINYTWLPGLGFITDSYNVSVNGFWNNGTTQTFNLSNVGPHGWSNITVFAYNNSGGGSLSLTPATNNTQVANNLPVQTLIDNFAVTAGNLLTFTVSATDADSDHLTFSTNATGGSLNQTTGIYKWMPASTDNGTYFWSFSSDDGYGGIATNTTTIIVSDIPPSMTYINGTVKDSSTGEGIEGVKVSTNTTFSTNTDASGFYSLAVTAGAYELTAKLDPVYYTNSSAAASVGSGAVVVQDIELLIKPTGTITGSVSNG